MIPYHFTSQETLFSRSVTLVDARSLKIISCVSANMYILMLAQNHDLRSFKNISVAVFSAGTCDTTADVLGVILELEVDIHKSVKTIYSSDDCKGLDYHLRFSNCLTLRCSGRSSVRCPPLFCVVRTIIQSIFLLEFIFLVCEDFGLLCTILSQIYFVFFTQDTHF